MNEAKRIMKSLPYKGMLIFTAVMSCKTAYSDAVLLREESRRTTIEAAIESCKYKGEHVYVYVTTVDKPLAKLLNEEERAHPGKLRVLVKDTFTDLMSLLCSSRYTRGGTFPANAMIVANESSYAHIQLYKSLYGKYLTSQSSGINRFFPNESGSNVLSKMWRSSSIDLRGY